MRGAPRRPHALHTRRDFLKLSAGLAASATAPPLPAWNAVAPGPRGEVATWVTAGEKRYQPGAPLRWEVADRQTDSATIELDPQQRFQQILGFGAAFTDAACYLLHQFRNLPGTRSSGNCCIPRKWV